jgi:hypothetical protein
VAEALVAASSSEGLVAMTDQTTPEGWAAIRREPRIRPLDMLLAEEQVRERIRRRRLKVLTAVAAALGCFLALIIAVRATHPRDEADFLLAVRDAAPVGMADDDLVAEGDAACQWLSWQERARWNHGRWFNRDAVLVRYIRTTRPVDSGAWGSPSSWQESRMVVADAAFSQLCGGTWWWHRPHGPSLGGFRGGDENYD